MGQNRKRKAEETLTALRDDVIGANKFINEGHSSVMDQISGIDNKITELTVMRQKLMQNCYDKHAEHQTTVFQRMQVRANELRAIDNSYDANKHTGRAGYVCGS